MGNPEKIEIAGLKTIHKLCKFGADHNMEGCTFTEIVERMFDELAKAQAVPKWISVKDQLPPNDPYNREYWVYETLNNKVQHDYWVCPDSDLDQDFEPFFNNWSRTVTHWMPMVKYPKPPVQAQEPTND